ncbi:hypothetical protein DFH28DRAFT_914213 [Melampsora americana]|nr:hypothetical protein DFH28DRAFT_914213 [Melampsora americana]
MLKEAQITQAVVRRRVRRLAKTPRPSLFKIAPLNMPIDYYDPEWFKSVTQKRLVANTEMVAFLPDASKSLMPPPHRHPDEELGDTNFTVKYLDILSEPYGLLEGDDEEFEDDDEDDDEEDEDAIELDEPEEQDESDDDLFEEGEYGDLYDDRADASSDDEE